MEQKPTKPLVGSLRNLEHLLEIGKNELEELLAARRQLYQPYKALKKQHPYPGAKRLAKAASAPPKYRDIDNPVKQLKDLQKRILKRILADVELPGYMFGAVSGQTLVKHAECHIPNQGSIVVKLDVSSYYPSITCNHVYFVWNVILGCPPRIASLLTELTTYRWKLPQGAPTSPCLANIFLGSIYAPICLVSASEGLVISTWVDDLIFSGTRARNVMETVRKVLASNGFRIAPEKRYILGPKDSKDITGGRLGRHEVRLPHKKMNDLRAAIHWLAIGKVSLEQLESYRKNLAARIAHVDTVHKGDAAVLRRQAEKRGVIIAPPKAKKIASKKKSVSHPQKVSLPSVAPEG